MIRQNEIEEIIKLIYNGYDLNLLSFELDIPEQEIQDCKKQLQLRIFVKESIQSGEIQLAIERLSDFIKNNKNSIVEKMMLLKLKAYINKTKVDNEDLKQIELERKEIGFLRSIDEILTDLNIELPKRKKHNFQKKEKQNVNEQIMIEETVEEEVQEEVTKPDLEKIIINYKKEIEKNPKKSLNARNLLAFTYFRAGKIEESRDELFSIIEQFDSYTAYRQLINLEKTEGNYEDAKLWAYECLDKFPNSIEIREQLISIARVEENSKEIIKLLKEILNIDSGNKRGIEMLEKYER